MATNTGHHPGHDWQSQEYVDSWIGRDATRDEDRRQHLQRMAALLPYDLDAEIRVLDVGAGYGAASQAVLETFPNAHVVLQDFSAPMLEHARQRLARYEGRTSYVLADFTDPKWVEAVGQPADAAVSAIAIHNLRGPETIARIYSDIFTIVKPGGAFLNWELAWPGDVAGEANAKAGLVMERWRRFEKTGVQLTLEELAEEHGGQSASRTRGRQGQRTRPTLLDNLNWLRAAGFDEVECFWREGSHALIGGYRRCAAS